MISESDRNEILSLMRSQKVRKVSKILSNLFKNASSSSERLEICDLIGVMLSSYSESFLSMSETYFEKKIRNLLLLSELYEMDKYILEKYCLYAGENILLSFYGKITHTKSVITGRLYLTPNRLIICGHRKEKKFTVSQTWKSSPTTIGGVIKLQKKGSPEMLEIFRRLAIRKNINRAVHQKLYIIHSENKPYYGNQYLIMNAYSIKKEEKKISFSIPSEFENKEIAVDITVEPMNEKEQTKEDFASIKERTLNFLYEKIKAHMKITFCEQCKTEFNTVGKYCPSCGKPFVKKS